MYSSTCSKRCVQLLYRYIYVKVSTQVTPNRLLDSGRITAKSVFIITNVDNRHHINIVLDFNKYLKSHCAVGEVYFALDPKTGITSQGPHLYDVRTGWGEGGPQKAEERNKVSLFLYRVSHPIVREISSCFVLGVPLPCSGSS